METMCDVNGAGLAAIQVGASERIFIIEATAAGGEPTDQPKVFINPKLELFSSETDVKEEGCLSFPSIFIPVKRSLKVRVSALDIDGKPFTLDVEDFYARAIQHENDHLINKLLFDYAGPLKKQMIKRKLDKMTDEEAFMSSAFDFEPQPRRASVAVDVGGVIVGGGAPVVVQSFLDLREPSSRNTFIG